MNTLPARGTDEQPSPDEFAKLLFGSLKKTAIGIWIVGMPVGEPFSVTDAVEAYTGNRFTTDGQIGGYLKTFSDHALLDRLVEPELRMKRYSRTDSPIWGIFEAAKIAFEL